MKYRQTDGQMDATKGIISLLRYATQSINIQLDVEVSRLLLELGGLKNEICHGYH